MAESKQSALLINFKGTYTCLNLEQSISLPVTIWPIFQTFVIIVFKKYF